MKLLVFMINGYPHNKNWEAIQRMCKSYNIEFEYTNCINRIKNNDYDILYSMASYINPYDIPENIKIIYGPQLWVFPSGQLLGKFDDNIKNRCVYNSLSVWVEDLYREFGEFTIPIYQFPFSVNINKFNYVNKDKEYDCLVYVKRRSNELINYTISLLNEKNLKYKIIKYGSYNEEDYLLFLNKSKFMISLDAHESQGFALEEAMSCNIPLLVVDSTSMYDETDNGIDSTYNYLKVSNKKLSSTSVPYWSDECGIKISDKLELSQSINKMVISYETFTARNYIVRTLSDEVCMKRILDYFKI